MFRKNSATRNKKRSPNSPQPVCFEHLRNLPDGLTGRDFEWSPVMSAADVLELKWQRWRATKDAVNRDWLKAQLERVALIALEVDHAKQQTAMEEDEEKRRAYFSKDHQENQQCVATLVAAHRDKAEEWKAAAQQRLRKATAAMNRETIARERILFGITKRRHTQ